MWSISNIFLVKVEIVMTIWEANYKIEDAYRPQFSHFTLINISQNNYYQSRLYTNDNEKFLEIN